MRKVLLMVAGLGLVAALAPLTANAECNSNVIIFNRPAAVNSGYLVCLGSPDTDDIDGRLIYPGSTGISVRFISACTVGEFTDATLTGELYPGGKTISLKCAALATGSTVFDSATIALPAGGQGCVKATMDDPAFEGTNTTYHTFGSTC